MGADDVDLEEAIALRSKVQGEMDRNLNMQEVLKRPARWDHVSIILSLSLIVLSAGIMLVWSTIPLVWTIVTFVLYSFNYLIFFLPISRHPGEKMKERGPSPKRPIRGPLRYLLKKKRMFALEVGATMFLVGIVPLAASFYLLFGIGLVFTFYYGVFQSVYPMDLTFSLIVQILLIMGYLTLVVLVSPQSQGFTRIARSIKFQILTARSKGKPAYIWALAVSGIIFAILSLIAIGGILLPGRTLNSLMDFFEMNGSINLLWLLFILLTEFFIMRFLQSRGSRRMALALLEQEAQEMRVDCLEPLDAVIDAARSQKRPIDGKKIDEVLSDFYPLAIYDVVETNIFGRSPVFLVVPKVDLLLDEDVLRYVGLPHDMEGKPILDSLYEPETVM